MLTAAPELQDKVSLPDINSGAGLANFGGVIYAAGGDEQNIQPGLDLMKKINATKFWTRGGETKTQFESGDIYAAVFTLAGAHVPPAAISCHDRPSGDQTRRQRSCERRMAGDHEVEQKCQGCSLVHK